jgi:hypothetical protein
MRPLLLALLLATSAAAAPQLKPRAEPLPDPETLRMRPQFAELEWVASAFTWERRPDVIARFAQDGGGRWYCDDPDCDCGPLVYERAK